MDVWSIIISIGIILLFSLKIFEKQVGSDQTESKKRVEDLETKPTQIFGESNKKTIAVFVNPNSGARKAKTIFDGLVKQYLVDRNITVQLYGKNT